MALRCNLVESNRAGRSVGNALGHAGATLLLLLDLLPVGDHLLGARRIDVAEDMGVPVDQLVVDAAGHIGQREEALFLRQPGVEDDLEEKVAQLFGQMVAARGLAPASRPE